MAYFQCMFVLFFLLCNLVLNPEASLLPAACPLHFNIAFITMPQLWGSAIMRGLMVQQAVISNPSYCASAIVFPERENITVLSEFFADRTSKLNVCIFVKMVYKAIVSACEDANALIFDDVVDNSHSARDMVKHILLRSETLIHTPLYATYLVQSTYLAEALMRVNVSAYYYPHHHSNDFPEYTFLNASSAYLVGPNAVAASTPPSSSEPLIVGFVAGNRFNIPDISTNILPGICAVSNTNFHVINQRVKTSVPDDSPSLVNSSVTYFNCQQDPERTYYVNHTQFVVTSVVHPKDPFKQLAYYMDDSLMQVDVGLVWTNKHIHPQNLYDFEMLRPPTRMLHWLSRGVPVMFYPTHSYIDVARHNGYGKGVVPDAHEGEGISPEVGGILQVTNADTLSRAVRLLHDAKVREQLSQQSTHIASHYTVERMTARLMQIIINHGISCLCVKRKRGSGFVCQAQHFVQKADIQSMCDCWLPFFPKALDMLL